MRTREGGQFTNVDVARAWAKNYYGAPGAKTGSTPATDGSPDWTTPLNQDSNYADEARSVAKAGSELAGGALESEQPRDRARRRRASSTATGTSTRSRTAISSA